MTKKKKGLKHHVVAVSLWQVADYSVPSFPSRQTDHNVDSEPMKWEVRWGVESIMVGRRKV